MNLVVDKPAEDEPTEDTALDAHVACT